MGYTLNAAEGFEQQLREAGFQDVRMKYRDWPVGMWAKGEKNKKLGRLTAENFKDGIRNSIRMFTGMLGWTEEAFQVFAANATAEIDSGRFHLWVRV